MATAYWEKRVKLAQRSIDRRDKALIDKLSNSFDRINGQLNSDINKIISTYTRKTGLTPEQAFKYLNEGVPLDVRNELLAKIQTVATHGERRKLETLMNTDRYQGRITRLDAIRADTRIALTKNAEVQLAEVTNHLKATAQSSYARAMFDVQKASGLAFSPHGVSAASINKILRTPWSGATYSSRVWKARDAMAANLDGMMVEMFSMGKLSDQSLKDLRGSVDLNKWRQQATSKFKSETDYAKYAANRLVRTETAYVANAADAEAYEECEIEKYEFISVLDMRTSPVCREHDGKIYALSEKEEGVNYPPLHPFCRSAVAPSLDSVNRTELQRRARDPKTGKNVLIPADMNYNEWKAWVDDGSPDIKSWRAGRSGKPEASGLTPGVSSLTGNKDIKVKLGDTGMQPGAKYKHAISEGKEIIGIEKRQQDFAFVIEDVIDQQKYDGLPKVVNVEEYKELMSKGQPYMQRTYSADSVEVLDEYEKQLKSGKWYVDCSTGGAQYGQGMYTSAAYDISDMKQINGVASEMKHYTQIGAEEGRMFSRVETLTLDPSAKIIEYGKIEGLYHRKLAEVLPELTEGSPVSKVLIEHTRGMADVYDLRYEGESKKAKTLWDKVTRKEISYFDNVKKAEGAEVAKAQQQEYWALQRKYTSLDAGVKASEMGFDAINAEGHGDSGSYTVVLNRTKLVIFDGKGEIKWE